MNRFLIEGDWQNLYAEKWGDSITPESTAHPAKFARNLIRQLYQYLLGENLVSPGDTILDPFGGVGLGAADALANGLSYIGIELERRFVDMGQGCDCTGISKADWVRFYGRWDRANYKEGRHWCPQCLSEAKKILPSVPSEPLKQASFFDDSEALSASYIKDSGTIPHTKPHVYLGNIPGKFEQYARGNARAILLQGDSRRLIEVLRQNGIGAVVSSPPYADAVVKTGKVDPKSWGDGRARNVGVSQKESEGYGLNIKNLGNLPTGDLKAVITSSPFAGNSGGQGEASRNGIDAALFDRHQGGMVRGLGDSDGNLGAMQPKQSDLKAIVTSSPFVDSVGSDDPDKRGGLYRDPKRRGDVNLTGTYGDSDGQLGTMKAGEIKGVIGSPPYENSVNQSSGANDTEARIERMRQAGVDISRKVNTGTGGPNSTYSQAQVYGDSDGQIGATSGDTFWSAARLILEQCYLLLPDGGTAVFVTKDFVKNGEKVEFSSQWVELCQAIGFELYAYFRAWQVKPGPVQTALIGNDKDYTKEYKSFFRRLHEKKNPEVSVDWEDVLIFRKGESNA